MGVTFWAYSNAEHIQKPTQEQMDTCIYIDREVDKYTLGSIVAGGHYKADCGYGYGSTCGSFNDWREQLAELASYTPIYVEMPEEEPDTMLTWQWQMDSERIARELRAKRPYLNGVREATGGDFWELLNAADNLGVIGTELCKKLSRDFERYAERAGRHPDPTFRDRFNTFKDMFEISSNSGFLSYS